MVQQDDYKLDFFVCNFSSAEKNILGRMITVKRNQLNRFVSHGMSQVY